MLFCFNAGEIVRVAIEIEKNGFSFYERAAKAVSDPALRELFTALARDETHHLQRFEALLCELPDELKTPNVSDLDSELDLYIRDLAGQHVFGTEAEFKSELKKIRTIDDALNLALRFEKDSVIFYLGMQEATCEGKSKDTVNQLVQEEQQHVRRLSVQIRKCSDDIKGCLLNWPV